MSSIDAAVGEIAATQLGLITRGQADSVGLTTSAMHRRRQAGRWLPVEPRVYLINGAPLTWHAEVLACCLSAGGVASHTTAAVLHDIHGFRPGRPEITVPRGTRVRDSRARVHESGDFEHIAIVQKDAIPVTDPARLAVDLGAVTRYERYELAMDDLIGRRMLTWEDALDALFTHAARGRNGVGALRALLSERYGDDVSESALERAFERLFRTVELPRPVAQHEIFDSAGFVARVDFAYPELLIAIELDSRRYHLRADAFENDPRKRNRLKLAGWLVLEFTWKMVIEDPHGVLRQIRRAIDARSCDS